jgi:hypothetical protein
LRLLKLEQQVLVGVGGTTQTKHSQAVVLELAQVAQVEELAIQEMSPMQPQAQVMAQVVVGVLNIQIHGQREEMVPKELFTYKFYQTLKKGKTMANFAVITNNIVENTIIADSKESAEILTGKTCIEYFDENPASIGYGFNPDTNIFEQPPQLEPQFGVPVI